MKRINLTVDDELYSIIEKEAKKEHTSVIMSVYNLVINKYRKDEIDFVKLLKNLYEEIEKMKPCKFILNDLETFKKIKMVNYDDGNAKIATIRARVGRTFYKSVENKEVKNVKVVLDSEGEVQKRFNAILYEKIK